MAVSDIPAVPGQAGLINRKKAGSSPLEPADGAGGVKAYTWEEVAAHNTPESMWVSIRGKVYDITAWLDKHPGGKDLLLLFAGRECTDAFISYHPFTNVPEKILGKFEIGTLKTTEFPLYKPDSGFYRECSEKVKEYFEKNDLNPKAAWAGAWRMTLVFGVAFYCLFLMNNLTSLLGLDAWPVKIVAATVFGVCQALVLLHMMHDCSHGATSYVPRVWQVLGRVILDFFAGCSFTSWLYQHVVGHHVYTNVFLADPDLPAYKEGDLRRLVDRQVFQPMYAYQHLYLPPLYGLLGLKFRIQDFTDTFFSQTNGPQRVNPLPTSWWAELFISKTVWVLWRIVFPLVVLKVPAAQYWTLFLIAEFVTGWYLAFNFQVSHISTACDFPLGDKETPAIEDEWAVSQVKSSVDYAQGNSVMTFLAGALNYQTVHHLFPSVSQYHYPAMAPIIMEVSKKHGIKYNALPDFWAAFGAHIDLLKAMGAQGKGVTVHMG